MKDMRIQKLLLRALRETIKVHGPITKPLIGSAAKRAAGLVKAELNDKDKEK